jgi:hypothetical protein
LQEKAGTKTAALYSLSDGSIISEEEVPSSAVRALPIADSLLWISEDGKVSFGEEEIGSGTLCGAGATGERGYGFAIADGADISVFFADNGDVSKIFSFETHDNATEVYFVWSDSASIDLGDSDAPSESGAAYIFVSPGRGGGSVYLENGTLIRDFTEDAWLADAFAVDGRIAADFVSTGGERQTLLLDGDALGTVARMPDFLGFAGEKLISDDGAGRITSKPLYSLKELMDMAKEQTGNRKLTEAEEYEYNAV